MTATREDRLDQQAMDWATSCGATEQRLAEMEQRCSSQELSLSALRLWRGRSITLLNLIHDSLLESELPPEGDGDGLTAEKCQEVRKRIGAFLDERDE